MPARVLLVLLALAAAAAGAATAQEDAPPTFQKDRRGDVKGPLDAVRAAIGRSSDGRLRGEVTMASPWGADDLRAGRAPASICLRVFTKRVVDADPPDYLVCVTAPKTGDELVGRVLRERANGLPRPVADAVLSRPTSRTVFIRFAQADVGKPAAIRVSAEMVTRGDTCPEPLGCRDFVPEAPGVLQLRLRSSADRR
jgi:hypothetical protein